MVKEKNSADKERLFKIATCADRQVRRISGVYIDLNIRDPVRHKRNYVGREIRMEKRSCMIGGEGHMGPEVDMEE